MSSSEPDGRRPTDPPDPPAEGLSRRGCAVALVVLGLLLGVPAVIAVSADSSPEEIRSRLDEVYTGVEYRRVPRSGETDAFVVVEGKVRKDCRLTGQWFSLDDLAVTCDDDPQPQRRP